MKKKLSGLLAAAMLITSLSVPALAADTSALPALELDQPQSFTFQPTAQEDQDKGVAVATFTPQADGWYEFLCDTPYTGTVPAGSEDKVAMCTASICEESEYFAVASMGMVLDLSSLTQEEQDAIKKVITHPTELAFAAQLTGGTTYTYRVSNSSASDYTTNLTVKTHQHEYTEEKMEKATVSNDSQSYGGIYRECKTWYCPLIDYTKTFPYVGECVLSSESFVYDGKEKKPSVTVVTSDGKKLNSKYYTVSYKNNKNVGKATVVLKFKGNYQGTMTKNFKIVPQGTKFTKTVTKKNAVNFHWSQNKRVSGYQIQYATKTSFEGAKTVTVKGAKTTSKTIKKLKSGKKYYFRIRTFQSVNGKNFYSRWSPKKSARAK